MFPKLRAHTFIAALLALTPLNFLAAAPGGASSATTSNEFVATMKLTQPTGVVLQLRSLRDGHILDTLVRGDVGSHITGVSAVLQDNGKVLAAVTTNYCTSTLERINPSTNHVTFMRKVSPSISDLTLSPNGEEIAYVTFPNCEAATPSELARFGPNILVVMNLSNGTSHRTPTDVPGHPVGGLTWSPNGRNIAASYSGDTSRILIFSATRPNFERSYRVPNPSTPKGCSLVTPAWTHSGIVAAEGCGGTPPSPFRRLVLMTNTGRIKRSWTLPACVGGISTIANPRSATVIVAMNVGYGNGSCGSHVYEELASLQPNGLRTILHIPDNSSWLNLP
jgi:WD40 repeat protein